MINAQKKASKIIARVAVVLLAVLFTLNVWPQLACA